MVLTVLDQELVEAICAGADGYLGRHTPTGLPLSRLREVMEGGSPLALRLGHHEELVPSGGCIHRRYVPNRRYSVVASRMAESVGARPRSSGHPACGAGAGSGAGLKMSSDMARKWSHAGNPVAPARLAVPEMRAIP